VVRAASGGYAQGTERLSQFSPLECFQRLFLTTAFLIGFGFETRGPETAGVNLRRRTPVSSVVLYSRTPGASPSKNLIPSYSNAFRIAATVLG
jgi:hypothetical protein